MEYLNWGEGAKSLLFLPGGPGSALPTGTFAVLSRRWFDPFLEAGYVVWLVTRRRGMPAGHTIEDMADDYAQMISAELGGQVDLVVGESYGGMIAQHLAVRHSHAVGRLALVVSAAEVCDWGKQVDSRLAAALRRGDASAAGRAFVEYAIPGKRLSWVRRLVGPPIGRSLSSGKHYPPGDLLVETEAEMAFDSRPALPKITVPVILICGDRDQFFPIATVEETVELIPDCALVRYEGRGHMRVAASRRVAKDVLAWLP